MNGGSLNTGVTTAERYVFGFLGTGNGTQTGGTVSLRGDMSLGLGAGTTAGTGGKGTYTMNAPAGSITFSTGAQYRLYVAQGVGSTGTFEMVAGTITLPDITSDVLIGYGNLAVGTWHQTGGMISMGDQGYVGTSTGSTGIFNMDGGTFEVGDNLWISNSATAVAHSTGTINQTAGTISIVGNDPSFTGNFVVGNQGVATLNLSGGLTDLIVGDTTFNNSASFSLGNSGNLSVAQDGNVMIGRSATADGTVNQSGGTMNVAANVFAGSYDGAGKGVFTMTGGIAHVGVTSPTGGDVVIAYLAGSTGTVNLQGGTLDVTHGSGIIGAGLGTAAFSFTGGTLKMNQFNNTIFGGDLLGLTQNGATSLLDATGNSTQINGFYTLTDGTAAVGATRTISVAGNVQLDDTLSLAITGTNIGKLDVTGNLTLGATSVLDIQGNLATATTHVIATFTGSLTGLFGDASDATTNGYNVVYEANQITLDELDGDANHDGVVNIFDINAVSSNWDPTGPVAAFAPGNINHDTVVDIFDINQISSNWAHVATNGGPAQAQAVPEPSTLVIALLGLAGVVGYRRCRRSER